MTPSVLVLTILLGGLVTMLVFAGTRQQRKFKRLRKAGIYPESGKATDADVARLKRAGEIVLAVRCYREIHRVGLAEAHAAVIGTPTPKSESPIGHFPSVD
jgi:hypothetical protein